MAGFRTRQRSPVPWTKSPASSRMDSSWGWRTRAWSGRLKAFKCSRGRPEPCYARRVKRDRIVELDKQYVWHPYTQMERYRTEDPLVIVSAEGPYLVDADGRRYLDANASWWVSTLGHR